MKWFFYSKMVEAINNKLPAWNMFKTIDKIFQVMDADIEGQYSLREAMKVAHIAVQCLSDDPRKRPNMDEVVRLLEQLYDSNDTMSVNV